MTDKNEPETIADEDLDNAQGGFGTWAQGHTHGVKAGQQQGAGFGTWGTTSTHLKQPGTNMEVVNEDE